MHVTLFAECQLTSTRQSVSLPSAIWLALGKEIVRRVLFVRRVRVFWHSANSIFAECSRLCTRQISGHSAYVGFPVVLVYPLKIWDKRLFRWFAGVVLDWMIHLFHPFEISPLFFSCKLYESFSNVQKSVFFRVYIAYISLIYYLQQIEGLSSLTLTLTWLYITSMHDRHDNNGSSVYAGFCLWTTQIISLAW